MKMMKREKLRENNFSSSFICHAQDHHRRAHDDE